MQIVAQLVTQLEYVLCGLDQSKRRQDLGGHQMARPLGVGVHTWATTTQEPQQRKYLHQTLHTKGK